MCFYQQAMSIVGHLFGERHAKRHYTEASALRSARERFEHYLFSVHEKALLVAEISNMAHDLEYRHRGYIKEHEKVFSRDTTPRGGRNYQKDRSLLYFKGWTNTRLKRLKKILEVETRSGFGIEKQKGDIVLAVKELHEHFSHAECSAEAQSLEMLISKLRELEDNLSRQKQELDRIYPIKDWSHERHKSLFSDTFTRLLFHEAVLLFCQRTDNLSLLPALISQALHSGEVPDDALLKKLIGFHEAKARESRKIEEDGWERCFHGRPIDRWRQQLFPLDTRTKPSGFFVDTKLDETIAFLRKFYNAQDSDLEFFEISMPKRLWKRGITDPYSAESIRRPLEHAIMFKPTLFPLLNHYYMKGLIKIKRIK